MSLPDDSAKDEISNTNTAANGAAGSDSAGSDAGKDAGASKQSLASTSASGSTSGSAHKALSPSGMSPVNPFLAAAAEDKVGEAAAPRPFMSRVLDYSAHAAIAAGLIGFAWTMGGHWMKSADTPAAVATTTPAATPQPLDEMAQLRLSNQKMHDEIKALRTSVDTLRSAVRRDTSPEQLKMLAAGLETVKGSLANTSETIGQLNSKVDKLQPGKVQQLNERMTRLEHQGLDAAATGSIDRRGEPEKPLSAGADAGKNVPKPPVKPSSLASMEPTATATPDEKPVLSGWVVRDVYRGVALVEGKRGTLEVVPGVALPGGAGVVKSIDRKGSGWVVTTSKGQFSSVPTQTAQQREPRRNAYPGPYDNYPRYRYDY